jgi:hypothetical protein
MARWHVVYTCYQVLDHFRPAICETQQKMFLYVTRTAPPFLPDPKLSNFSFFIFSTLEVLPSVLHLSRVLRFIIQLPSMKRPKKNVFPIKITKFSRFVEIWVFKEKPSEAPQFLRQDTSYRAEIFSGGTRNTLGCLLFFIWKHIVSLSFVRSYKRSTIQKTCGF